jgi:hypothetical protein
VREAVRKSSPTRFFVILLPVALVIAAGILYFSTKKFLAESSCGCGYPSEEATGEFEQTYSQPIFNNQPVNFDLAQLAPVNLPSKPAVLGATDDNRWIEIDLSDQKLFAHEGDKIVYEFLVSSGKWAPTPTGEFRIWGKFRYTKMSGGNKAIHTYYYLPNVPYTQYFYKDFGLHGTYWHNNFGHPMSHGCVNLATPDAEKLFYWTSPAVPENRSTAYASKDEPGTRVIIHD